MASMSPCNFAMACCRDFSICMVTALEEGPDNSDPSDYELAPINPPFSGIFAAFGEPARDKLILCFALKNRKHSGLRLPKLFQAKKHIKNVFFKCKRIHSVPLFTPDLQVSNRTVDVVSRDSSSPASKKTILHPAPLLSSFNQPAFLRPGRSTTPTERGVWALMPKTL